MKLNPLCFSLAGSVRKMPKAEAEELAQETFVRVWQQRVRYRPGAEFRPWVFAIAVNLARNRLRWWRRRPLVALDAWAEGVADAAARDGRATAERAELSLPVQAAVAALPLELREAIVLAEYEQLSHAEIALAVGATPVQVMFDHVLPLAMPGILTGTILGLARALGETAPLLMIGMRAFIAAPPRGLTDPATVLPVQIFLWSDQVDRGFIEKTSAAIIVLLVFLLAMNGLAIYLRNRFETRW